jgi:uncharacterized membrane protein
MKYASTLTANLPPEVEALSDEKLMKSLGNPRALLDTTALNELSDVLVNSGPSGPEIRDQTVEAIRLALYAGLKVIFIIGAITMLITFLTICLLPSLSIDAPAAKE